MADQALVTVGTVEEEVVTSAFNVIGKGGTVVITGLANPEKLTVHVSGGVMTLFEKTIKGTLFGSANPQYDIVKLLRLYDAGQLKLDELVTTRYSLDQVNEGYQDLRDGKNIRGVIVYDTNLRAGQLVTAVARSAAVASAARWSSTVARPAPMVLTDTWVAPAACHWRSRSASSPGSPRQLTRPSRPIRAGSRPAARAASSTWRRASSRPGPGGICGNQPSARRPARR
jgi:hypothetical protein